MYEKLLATLKQVPKLYESSGYAFWDDDHISKMMLQNHLAPDSAGATREHSIVAASVEWILSLPISDKKLLDLGCGPGIYAERFAASGYNITGVDISRRSIDYARESARSKGYDIEYRCSDYLAVDLGVDQFDLAVMIYCDYGVLPPKSRKQLLDKTFAALKPGGLLVLDTFSPAFYQNWVEDTGFSYEDGGFWSDKPHAVMTVNKCYPDQHYLERYVVTTQDDCRSYNNWNHAFHSSELIGELESAGFESPQLFADVCGNEYDEASETICAVVRKPGDAL